MQISKEKIEAVKRSNDLVSVIKSHGKGSNYVGLCPFHKEKTPSFTVNPKTNLYHCFGCNAGGDVIGFVCKTEGIGFREAYEKLSKDRVQGAGSRVQRKDKKASVKPSATHTRLLNRVVSFYHKSFCEDQRALKYLTARVIKDNNIYTDFKLGYSNGTLLNTIADDGDIYKSMQEIGILNDKGN